MTLPKIHRPVLAAALLAGTALGGFGASLAPATAQGTPAPIATQPVPAVPGFADLVSRVRPAVVTITSTETALMQPAASRGSDEDGMPHGLFGMPGRGQPDGGSRTMKALGSGFLVDAEGHVVTNNHVVEGASKVVVTLDDGREMEAKVVGRDPRTDVAVLKVDAGAGLPFLSLGDSDKARPGDWVVAMGNPFGLGGSVTAGIVSARGRDIGAGPYDDFLQVDAPINRGNSGGPLFGTDGTVLGVNTAIYSPSGGSVGIGFAIPSNVVKEVVAELEAHGHVERGFLGVSTQKVNPAMAAALKLSKAEGALVADVQPDGPAAAAGLKPGDVVTAVNGVEVQDPRALARQVAALHPGATAQLAVQRDGAAQTLSVKAEALPEQTAVVGAEAPHGTSGKIGLALAPLSQEAREGLNVPGGTKGAVIAAVRPDSPASEAGLRAGDVLLGVGNHPVGSPEDAVRAIGSRDSKQALALRVLRDGHSLFVAISAAQG
jgi:serine protease Do